MKKFLLFLTIIFLLSSSPNATAALCKKVFRQSITMNDDWYKKEELRLADEEELLKQYASYIIKENKPLTYEPYHCTSAATCDPVRNCQMEKDVKDFHEVEYSMRIDSGFIIQKSYCSVIGKCIGYNDFFHTSEVTAAEDRLIDIKKDNAIFYHYFYSAKSNSYEPPFNITNFHTGYELYLDDIPHFSPDGKTMITIRSVPKQADSNNNIPTGYSINIYQINEFGEYRNVEPPEIDPQNPDKIISTFLSRNPACGETPHFHSWKNDSEIRISMMPPSKANEGMKVILSYDKKLKKWGCKEDIFPKTRCESYLPSSTKFTSNLASEQINDCQN